MTCFRTEVESEYHVAMHSPLFLEVDEQDRSQILERFPHACLRSGVLSHRELVDACKGYTAVCCFIYTRFTSDVLESLPDLKLLCTRSVGYGHIDLDACKRLGITVCNVPDYGSHVIAEHVFALLLTALRHVTEAKLKVKEGNFDYHGLRGMALMGKTMGIVGTGSIGTHTAMIAHGFGMRVLATDRCRNLVLEQQYGVRYVDPATLYRESDILSLHVPSVPETHHMINDSTLSQMKRGVIIVNTARGELIDSMALLRGIQSGHVARALLDVLEHERDVAWNAELIGHPNVIVTPHIAFYADDSMHRMYEDCLTSITEFQQGLIPQHIVRPASIICDLPGVRVSATDARS